MDQLLKMNALERATKMLKKLQDDGDYTEYEGQAEFIFLKEITDYYYFVVRNFVLETNINISQETKNIFKTFSQTLYPDKDFFISTKKYDLALKDILKNISASDFIEKTFN